MTRTHMEIMDERTTAAAKAGAAVGAHLAWMGILRAALTKRLEITDPASRTRWREYVRCVLFKIRAARKLSDPLPGTRLANSVGRAMATAGLIGNYGGPNE